MQLTDDPRVPVAPDDGSAPARPRTRRLRSKWLWIAVASVLVLAGAITSVAVGLRYAHAAPLSNFGGGWVAPDEAKSVELGPYSGMVVPARPGAEQSFCLLIGNESPVTQEVLGLAGDDVVNAKLSVSGAIGNGGTFCDSNGHYGSAPVAWQPGTTRSVRVTVTTPPCSPGASFTLYWDQLDLRVRVGWFTRIEHVELADLFVIKASC